MRVYSIHSSYGAAPKDLLLRKQFEEPHDSLGGLDAEERNEILSKMTQVPDSEIARLENEGGHAID